MLSLLAFSLAFADDQSAEPTYDQCRLGVVVPSDASQTKKLVFVPLDLQGKPNFGEEIVVEGKGREFRAQQRGLLYTVPFSNAVKSVWFFPGVEGVFGMTEVSSARPDQSQLAPSYQERAFALTHGGLNGPLYIVDAIALGCQNLAKK